MKRNPSAYRSMRDHIHPPRMSAPSCIVPPTEQMVIRPHIVPLLPTFHGMESENPYSHIREFEEVCNTFKEETATVDLMMLKPFPFTLKDKEKIYLNSLCDTPISGGPLDSLSIHGISVLGVVLHLSLGTRSVPTTHGH